MKKYWFFTAVLAGLIFLAYGSVAQATNPNSFVVRKYYGIWYWPLGYDSNGNQLGTVTSYVGGRSAPTNGASTNHHGTDISRPRGSNVYAARNGTVYYMKKVFGNAIGWNNSAGKLGLGDNWLVIDHGDGFYTAYGHLSELATFIANDNDGIVSVRAGDIIGCVGGGSQYPTEGVATGPHLHFETVYYTGGGGSVELYGYSMSSWGINGWEVCDNAPGTGQDYSCSAGENANAQRKDILSGVYVIHSAWDDNICLDISGDSTENNANIQLFHRVYNDVQKFRVIKWDESYYCIKSIYNGRWLDAASPIADHSNVKLFDNNNFDEDFWYFEDAGDGYVYIRNKTGYYLDVQGDKGEDHANIQLYHFVGNESQKWRLEDVTDYYALEDGVYSVQTALDNNYRLDIAGDSTENRANIQLFETTDLDVQLYRFTNMGSYYVVQSVYSNKWLDVHMPIGNNANVQLWEDNAAAEEHWVLEDAGDGYVYMRSGRDYYLDVQGSAATNHANVQVYRFLGDSAQKWKISRDKPEVKVTAGTSMKETVIEWNKISNVQQYGIQILDSENNYAHVRWNYNKEAFSALLPEGDYRVRIIAVKNNINYDGDYIPFTVSKAYASEIGESSIQREWNHTLYKLYPKDCSWLEAKALCEQEGGHLLTITSQGEQDIAASMVADYGRLVFIGAEGYTRYDWRWVTKEPFTYQNWTEAQPDNCGGTENCGHLYTDGTWNDISCSAPNVHGFIAEYSPVSISVTPSDELQSLIGIDYEQEMEERTAYYTSHIRENLAVQVTFSDGTVVAVDDYEVATTLEQDEQTPSRYSYAFTVTYGELSDTSDISITLKPEPTFGEPDLILPSALDGIDESAFEGIAASVVYIPDTCTSIGKWAFRNCPNLGQIRVPAGCVISADAFEGCNRIVIFGAKGSMAETYAKDHANCIFVAE